MNTGATIAKYLLFFFNLIFVIAGLAFAGLGAYGIYYLKKSDFSNANEVLMYPSVLLAVGFVMFLIAFCGCCGSIKEIKCLLIMYAIILVALAAVKIFFTVKVIQGNLEEFSKDMVDVTFNKSPYNFHVIEEAFKCCGTTGGDSYTFKEIKLPPTCCEHPVRLTCPKADYEGCVKTISGFFHNNGANIAYAAIAVIAFEFLAVVFAVYVTAAIKTESYRY